MKRDKRICDHFTLPLERGQRARWEAAALLKAGGVPGDLANWAGAILDAAADYERAVGRNAAEVLQLMVPVPLRPLLRGPGRRADGHAAEIAVPAVGVQSKVDVPTVAAATAAAAEDLAPAAGETLPAGSRLTGS